MGMKAVELGPEDSKEFIALLESDAGQEEINDFLTGKVSADVPAESVAALEKMAELEELQETEITLLAKLGTVRRGLQAELVEILLNAGKDKSSPPAEETSPICTDPKAPS